MCNIIERSGPRQDTGEDDLEAEIIESAAIQEAISDKISQVKRILNMFTTPIPPAMLNVPAAEYICATSTTNEDSATTQATTHPTTSIDSL